MSDVLTMAAEVYIEAKNNKHEVNEASINEYLQKSLMLNPRDQCSGLTWLDYLIEKKDIAAIENAFEIIQYEGNNVYFKVRLLQTAILKNDVSSALQFFSEIIKTDLNSDWIFNNSYQAFHQHGLQKQLYTLLKQQVKSKSSNPLVGMLWAQFCIDNEKRHAKIFEYLNCLEEKSPQWLEAMEVVLTPKNKTWSTRKVIKLNRDFFQENTRLWSLVSFYYAKERRWGEVMAWCNKNWQRDSNPAWAVYLYGFGLRRNKKWKEAAKVNSFAKFLTLDDYEDNIILWYAIDGLLADQVRINEDDLIRIRYPELSPFEQYAYHLLKAMHFARTRGGLLNCSEVVISALNDAKTEGQSILSDSVVQLLKGRARRVLQAQIKGSLWTQIVWRLRLFNLM